MTARESTIEPVPEKLPKSILNQPASAIDVAEPLWRIGSVPYLNAAPLTWGMDGEAEFCPPSELSVRLQSGELDAALLSVTEVFRNPDMVMLDGYGICSDGPVFSVILAHSDDLENVDTIYLDPSSCTSVMMLKVLMESMGLKPLYQNFSGSHTDLTRKKNFLIIGNPAIEFRMKNTSHKVLDLGAQWTEMTGFPFVYAGWIARRNADVKNLRNHLNCRAESGLSNLEAIHRHHPDFNREFREFYVGNAIHYRLGQREFDGLNLFSRRVEELMGSPLPNPYFINHSINS